LEPMQHCFMQGEICPALDPRRIHLHLLRLLRQENLCMIQWWHQLNLHCPLRKRYLAAR
jgi:hypothetical protein